MQSGSQGKESTETRLGRMNNEFCVRKTESRYDVIAYKEAINANTVGRLYENTPNNNPLVLENCFKETNS